MCQWADIDFFYVLSKQRSIVVMVVKTTGTKLISCEGEKL